MARPIPGPTTIFDKADRADGPAADGAGALIWDDTALGGGASAFIVDSNLLRFSSDDQGVLTKDDFDDLLHVVFFDAVPSGPFGYYWRLQNPETSGWDGYWFVADGANWAIRKRSAGGTVAETLDSVTVTSTLFRGVMIRVYGDTFEVYRYEDNAYAQEPILSATDPDYADGRSALYMPFTTWKIERIEQGDPSLAPPDGPFTLHVNPDHPEASDEYTRLEASDPDTPLASITAAVNLAYATPSDSGDPWGDTIQVEPATAIDNPELDDGRMYPAMDHRSFTRAALPNGWPFGDNDGYAPITVAGHVVSDQKPILFGLNARGLKNWRFQDLQWGYDIGSGFEYGTLTTLERVKDLRFTRCDFTGGGHQVFLSEGEIVYDDCTGESAINPAGAGPNDGRLFVFSYSPNDPDGGENSADITIRNSRISMVRNDAIQLAMGARVASGDQWGSFTLEDSLLHNVTELGAGGNPSLHADSVQSVGGPEFTIQRNKFIGCSDAYIASDFGHGTIRIEANLAVGYGGLVQLQGFDHAIIQHNTLLSYSQFVDASVLFYTRTTGTAMRVTAKNNIVGGFNFRDSTPAAYLHPDSVFENNLSFTDPGGHVGDFGTHLAGIPELGTSARLEDIPTSTILPGLPDPLPANYELATEPFDSPGVGQGFILDDGPATDLYGRAWASPPDVGCLQSDSGTPVAATARPPYVITKTPAANASDVSDTVSVVAVLFPKPGETLDLATVDTSSAYVTDVAGEIVPAIVTVDDPDEDGQQALTIDLRYSLSPPQNGRLYPLVAYTVHLTSDIQDTEGSALVTTSWTFVVAGPDEPAIYPIVSSLVGLRARRTASLDAPRTTAAFERPAVSASFEQADPRIVR